MNITLYGKGIFADMITLRGGRELSWIIRVAPKCHYKSPQKREVEGDFTHTEEKNVVKTKAEMGMMWPQAKERK